MKRAAARNLDSTAADMLKSPGVASPGTPQNFAVNLPLDACIANLNSIGISLDSSTKAINVSYNALKRIEVDRTTVQPRTGRDGSDANPFDLSDEEDPENDSGLLSHLVKDITDVDLDDLDLGTRICDLKVAGRKSKSACKKDKAQKRAQILNKSVSP